MEFIYVNEEERPKVIYTPYFYATYIDCSKFYFVYQDRKKKSEKVRIILKEKENEK